MSSALCQCGLQYNLEVGFHADTKHALAWISTEGEFPNIRNAKRFTRLGNFAVAVG
jgi:hypothetical protein